MQPDGIPLVVTDRDHRRVLVTSGPRAVLPTCAPPPSGALDPMETAALQDLAARRLDLDLRSLFAVALDAAADRPVVAALEWLDSDGPCPAGMRWIEQPDLHRDDTIDSSTRDLLEAWFAEQRAAAQPDHPAPWIAPGWFARVAAWIDAALARLETLRTGPIEHVRSFYCGATLRARTSAGRVYFKAASPVYTRDAAVARDLAAWQPTRIPTPLATDLQRGWMLTAEVVGPTLRQTLDARTWCDVLAVYAQLQRESLHMPRIAGLYDWSVETVAARLPDVIEELDDLLAGFPGWGSRDEIDRLRRLLPQLLDSCAAVRAAGVPAMLEHCDLHGDNVRLAAQGPVFLDWAWSCRTHPFVGALRLIRDAELADLASHIDLLRSAYLDSWSAYGSRRHLEQTYERARRWATVLHVVMDAEWLRCYRQCLRRYDLPEGLFLRYTWRRRQYYLHKVVRRLCGVVA